MEVVFATLREQGCRKEGSLGDKCKSAPTVFGISVNPISTKEGGGAHYAHQITTLPPSGYSNLCDGPEI